MIERCRVCGDVMCVDGCPTCPEEECWLCFPGRKSEIHYTDVLGMKWCLLHFEEVYLDAPE